MSDTPANGNGVRITAQQLFDRLESVSENTRALVQSMDDIVKPTLVRHDARLAEQERQLDSLNVKFYGLLGGGVLGGLALLAEALGVFA